MQNVKPKHMKIKLDVETAKLVKVVDDYETDAVQVTQAEIEQIYQSPNGFRYIGTILHSKNSPGCMYFFIGGNIYKICV
jgi:hypothetical protein